MFAVRRAIARSFTSTSTFRHVAPQITRARVTPVPKITPARYFSQSTSRFADEPVQKEPAQEELKEVKEESILDPEIAEESQQAASTSAQAHAATSESTDQLPSEQHVADTPSNTNSTQQQYAATSESTARAARPTGTSLYLGNLQFDVDEAVVQQQFGNFGEVTSVKIVRDERGQSKGFGFITFQDAKAAKAAMEQLDDTVVLGRRIYVKPSTSSSPAGTRPPRSHKRQNPPSKTLFIGNMSYQMSDRDLNDLFRDIKNVIDVRVAIDRRSGQPRGFAHADFNDVDSAQAAAEVLSTKTIYGRTLKIDFSASSSQSSSRSPSQNDFTE